MLRNSTQLVLFQKLFELLERQRCGSLQEWVYWRAVMMVKGELFNVGRDTVTHDLVELGLIRLGLEWVVLLVKSGVLGRAESVKDVF